MKALLVSMPWASNARPSLGVGLLVAAGRRAGLCCDALYPTFDFAAMIGTTAYEPMAENSGLFGVSEHLFAVSVFGKEELQSDEFLSGYGEGSTNPFSHIRDYIVPAFVESVARRILQSEAVVVGFSCTFNQVFASLAVAKRLKESNPCITIIFGGACVHGPMGVAYARAFPQWLDHVFTGEADLAFPAFLVSKEAGATTRILGVTYEGVLKAPAIPATFQGSGPVVPDFDEWFAQRTEVLGNSGTPNDITIPFESSRGCWWGEKAHCTFCGLNNEGMTYRVKETGDVVREIVSQSERHRCLSFMAADNILDHRSFVTLLPALAALGIDLRLFYEVKANLTRDQVAMLVGAGVRWIQPGVESFSDSVLKLMRKGTSGLQNIQLLRLAAEYGVTVSYNMLVGFPGETDYDFENLASTIPYLMHLPPPSGRATQVQVHRFSPFFDNPEQHGISGVRACSYYRHLLPSDVGPREPFAYFFDRDLPAGAAVNRHLDIINRELDSWQRTSGLIRKFGRLGPGFIEIVTLENGRESRHVLDPMESAIVVLADKVTTAKEIRARYVETSPECEESIHLALERLVSLRLVVRSGRRLVSVVPFETPRSQADLRDWLAHYHGGVIRSSVPQSEKAGLVQVGMEAGSACQLVSET